MEDAGSTPAIVPIDDAAYWQDPHSALRAARERHSVAYASTGEPIVLRYADVERLASDHRNQSNALAFIEGQISSGPLVDWWRLMLTNQNGAEHRRLRNLVGRAFTPRAANEKRTRIRELTRALIDRHREGERMDVIEDFSHELPIRLICETLGVPEDYQAAFSVWSTDLGSALSSVLTPDLQRRGEVAAQEMSAAVRELIVRRRVRPEDDLLSTLIHAADELDESFEDEDLVVLVINLIFGGHDSSRSMIAVAVALLVAHPAELAKLRAAPDLATAAGEEVLRFEPIVPVLARESVDAFEVNGVRIEAHQPFWLSVLSANRDPAVFQEPDAFRIDRAGAHSFSFGWGAHRCIGAAFALAEISEVLPVFFDELQSVELEVEPPRWVPFANLRRLESLPIRFKSA